ncbi:MAG TPA: glycoside hydrolase domain-containing protein [Mobilitalea sp.]|nr:glycoside hydrolase domain-containing protein [Mobilitalea sp.]
MFRRKLYKKISILLILTLILGCLPPSYTLAEEGTSTLIPEFTGDVKVLEAQQWLNQTYTGKYTYVPVTEDGITGASTVKALIIALQIELGMGSSSNGSFGPTTTSKCPIISRSNPGINSNIIRILQHGLFCKGYGTYDNYGTFGSQTEAAVKNLESDAGLDQTGIVTPMIFKAILNTDPLKLNFWNGDPNIRYIQQSLNMKYNKYFGIMPTDGIYGRNTNKALIYGLQAEEGLSTSVANGSFGPTTTSLCPFLVYNDTRSNYVLLLQFVLYCNGYATGEFNGVYGDAVKSAVTEFQQFMILNVTGNADKGTQMSLYTTCGDTTRSSSACDTATRLNTFTVNTIKNAGYTYIGRYLTNANSGIIDKKMTDDEIQLILNTGLSIFPIYQTYGGSASYYTIEQAELDAVSAENAAKNFGFPEETTLYFAVDFDAYDYEVTDVILPYFKQLSETMQGLGINYSIGIYGPRNVCTRVYDAGYAKYCFVSDASSGYSGNLGYIMPKQWSFDQFRTDIFIGTDTGKIGIDKTAYSGRDKAVSSLDKNLSFVNEAYLMLEYLRHNQSMLVLAQSSPDIPAHEIQIESLYIMYTLLQNQIIKENSFVTTYIATKLENGETFCYDDISNIKVSLMESNTTANKYFAIWEQENEKERLSRVLSIVPLISSIKGFIDVLYGEDVLTGRELSWWESVLNISCAAMDAAAVASIAKVCLTEARTVELGLELKTLAQYGYSQEVAEMMASGRDAITYAKSMGVTDAVQLSNIGESVSEAVAKAYRSGIIDSSTLVRYGESVTQTIMRAPQVASDYADAIRSGAKYGDDVTSTVASVALDATNSDIVGLGMNGIWRSNPSILRTSLTDSDDIVNFYRTFLEDSYIDELATTNPEMFVGKNISSIKAEMGKLRQAIMDTKTAAANAKMYFNDNPLEPSFKSDRLVENCAEIWAVRDAILQGAKFDNIVLRSVYIDTGKIIPFCENCENTFKNVIDAMQ